MGRKPQQQREVALPRPIVIRFNTKVESGMFYEYAALLRLSPTSGRRENHYERFEALTIADLEQLVELHRRQAYKAIARFKITGSPWTAETAADHMFRAERYRMRYRELLGDDRPEEFVDSDPVFPEFDTQRTGE